MLDSRPSQIWIVMKTYQSGFLAPYAVNVFKNKLTCVTLLFLAALFSSVPTLEAQYSFTDLGLLPGPPSFGTFGSGINNSGQVAGYSFTLGGTYAMIDSAGVMSSIGGLGGSYRYGRGINDAGQVTGDSTTPQGDEYAHAFIYSGGVMHDLGTLAGATASLRAAINTT